MNRTMASVSHHHPNNSSLNSTDFMGLSNIEISHVPADVWEIFAREESATMKVYEEIAFDTLEALVCEKYGAPQNMVNNGRIYRGFETSDDVCNNRLILTFYKSTSVIRIQGAGYALWINKVLPNLATKVMETLSQNGLTSQQKNASQDTAPNLVSPCHSRTFTAGSPPSNCINSPPFEYSHICISSSNCINSLPSQYSHICNNNSRHPSSLTSSSTTPLQSSLDLDLIQSLVTATEEKAKYQMENKMLYDRISEMKAEMQTLHERVTEKEVDIKLLCNRVNEINVIEFEAECDRKLLKATEDRFDEERQQLLKQIEDLSNAPKIDQCAPAPVSSPPKPPTYSEVLQWSTVKRKGHRSTQITGTDSNSTVNNSNRFNNLVDQAEELRTEQSDSASQPSPPPPDKDI